MEERIQYRHEYKFLLNALDVFAVRARLPAVTSGYTRTTPGSCGSKRFMKPISRSFSPVYQAPSPSI